MFLSSNPPFYLGGQKPPKSKVEPKLRTNNLKGDDSFMDIADLIFNLKRPDVCNLTIDELLDKIGDKGMGSLTELEKQKLDEYSKSL